MGAAANMIACEANIAAAPQLQPAVSEADLQATGVFASAAFARQKIFAEHNRRAPSPTGKRSVVVQTAEACTFTQDAGRGNIP